MGGEDDGREDVAVSLFFHPGGGDCESYTFHVQAFQTHFSITIVFEISLPFHSDFGIFLLLLQECVRSRSFKYVTTLCVRRN